MFPNDTIEPSESVGRGRSVVPMATDEEIRSDLIGDSGTGVSRALVLAVKSLTEWPVDAFFVDVGDDREMVGWIAAPSSGS